MDKRDYFTMEESSSNVQENQSHTEAQGKKVCGCVILRQGYQTDQFLTLLLINFATFYAMITSVLFLVLLITSTDYYNIGVNESASTVSFIILATQIVNILVFLVIGLLYDTLGRKPILIVSELLLAACAICIPYGGSVFPGLLLARCGVSASSSAIFASPLIIDYVHDKSKGIALAIVGFVVGLSIILVSAVQLKLAETYKLQLFFYPPFVLCIFTAMIIFPYLKEPPDTARNNSNSSFCISISQKCSLLLKEIRTRQILVALICNFIVKSLDVYLSTLSTLWYSYNIFNQDTKKTSSFMNKFLGAASVCSFVLGFVLGCLADRINYRRIPPLIFLIIFIFSLQVYLADCMTCNTQKAALAISGTLIMNSNSAVTWLIARNVRSSAKGTVFGAYHLSGAVGLLFFGIVGALMVNSSGGKQIFLFVSLMGLLGAIVSMSLWMRKD